MTAWTVALACVMLAVAAREALARQAQRFEGWHAYALTLATLTPIEQRHQSTGIQQQFIRHQSVTL